MSKSETATLLVCPACGCKCRTLRPFRPTPDMPSPWWEDGQYALCQCGADLIVVVDDELARLVERNAEGPNG